MQEEIEKLRNQGKSYRQIAQILGIAKTTVEYRLTKYQGDSRWEPLNEWQQQLIYGSLLGDASLIKYKDKRPSRQGWYVLQFAHGEKQLDYLKFKHKILCSTRKILRRERTSFGKTGILYSFGFAHRPFLSELHKITHKNGRKTVSTEWLEKLSELGLAFWFQDDGHTTMSGRKRKDGTHTQHVARIATNGFAEPEINIILEYFINKWDLKFHKVRGDHGISIGIRCNAAKRFIDLIAPHLYLSYKSFKDTMNVGLELRNHSKIL